ncbi:MAG: M81 family metallopeptidase [Clostridiales bacterium]|nr:M81 family metallopeptidase [Clostridiales bacterium]
MRIAIGSLQCESNTLSPVRTYEADFDRAYGRDMLEKVNVGGMLRDAGAEIVPTLYAHALPGGPVAKEDFLRLAGGIVDALPADGLDGVWLYLHGAMYVEEIESGEEYLLERVREKIGFRVPVAVAMDFHANNTDRLTELANVVCGFRTAPHVDRAETEQKAMRLLLKCVREGLLPRPRMARAPVVIPGDAVQTALPPLNAIMSEADRMEQLPGVLCAQVFNGQPWVDAPYMGPNMVVTHESDEAEAQKLADRLAKMFWDARRDFRFLVEAVEPEEAVRRAMESEGQVFISDSGDNTTAGAAGDSAFMLNLLMRMGAGDALIAGIMDAAAVDECYRAEIGDTLTLSVGGSLAPDSERATITGRLVHRGEILGYTGEFAGESATLDCGNVTVLITKRRTAVTGPEVFESVGLDWRPYKIIVVKLGYLFPGLQRIAKRSILAFTRGGSTERLRDMGHRRIARPMFPLDDNFL